MFATSSTLPILLAVLLSVGGTLLIVGFGMLILGTAQGFCKDRIGDLEAALDDERAAVQENFEEIEQSFRDCNDNFALLKKHQQIDRQEMEMTWQRLNKLEARAQEKYESLEARCKEKFASLDDWIDAYDADLRDLRARLDRIGKPRVDILDLLFFPPREGPAGCCKAPEEPKPSAPGAAAARAPSTTDQFFARDNAGKKLQDYLDDLKASPKKDSGLAE